MRKLVNGVWLIYAPSVDCVNINKVNVDAIDRHMIDIGLNPEMMECYPSDEVSSEQFITELAARTCYQSWNEGRKHREHIRHLASVKHYSVFEHNIFTFALAGISRSLSHELVRHRHLSFSQLSQRYVDHSDPQYNLGFVVPPDMIEAITSHQTLENDFAQEMLMCKQLYKNILVGYSDLPKKKRQQLARYILPSCMETRMIVSGNARTWLEACIKRCPPNSTIDNTPSDAEIWRLFDRIKSILTPIMPDFWSDCYPDPPPPQVGRGVDRGV